MDKILVEEGRVTGVRLADGTDRSGRLVLASGGATETFYELVGKEYLTKGFKGGIEALTPMESVLMVHLGVDMDPGEHQPSALCYYYGTYDIEGGVHNVVTATYHEGKEGFLIDAPSMYSPDLAPQGCHAMTTLYHRAQHAERGYLGRPCEEWPKSWYRSGALCPGLRAHTRVAVTLTPDDFQRRTHLKHRAFGGIAPVMGVPNPAHQTPVRGAVVRRRPERNAAAWPGSCRARKVARRILGEAGP